MNDDWIKYHQLTKDRVPSPLLKEALSFVKDKNTALDLGAGALVDSKFLLSTGFKKVVAVDIVPFELVINDPKFIFVKSSFSDYNFPVKEFDLINANFALPFSDPENFNPVWTKMINSLVVGGIFSGQLFGINDGWSTDTSMSFHTIDEVNKLLVDMEVIKLEEVEKDGSIATGGTKHWHIFPLILKRVKV